ncbi:hypothetical protein CHUAL_004264 [Chamberlinius hualienensis]
MSSHSVIKQEDQYLQELPLDYSIKTSNRNSEASTMETKSDSKKRKIVPVPDKLKDEEKRQKMNASAKRSRDKRRAIESANRVKLAEQQRINEERVNKIAELKLKRTFMRRLCLTYGLEID